MRMLRNLPIGSILMVLAMVISQWLLGPAAEALVFDRAAVAEGEFWRWFSAHFIHSDQQHLIWNCLGLLLIGFLFERELGARYYLALLLGMLSVNLYLAVTPSLDYYCGLSGVLNTLLVVGLLRLMECERTRQVALLVLVAEMLKIIVELQLGAALFTDPAWQSVPMAHLYGALAGFVSGVFIQSKIKVCFSSN